MSIGEQFELQRLRERIAELERELYHDGPTYREQLEVCQRDLEKMTQRWRNVRAEERDNCIRELIEMGCEACAGILRSNRALGA